MHRGRDGARHSYKGVVIRETEKAYLFEADDFAALGGVWLPKSQCTFVPSDSDQVQSTVGTMLVPQWLAEEKDMLP